MNNQYYKDISIGLKDFAVGSFSLLYDGEYRRFNTDFSQCSYVTTNPSGICATNFEFYVPQNSIINPDLYSINSISINFYVPPSGIGMDSKSGIHNNLFVSFRNLTDLNKPQLQIPNTNAAQKDLFNTNSTNFIASGTRHITTGAWNSILLSSSFYQNYFDEQSKGFILLDFKRNLASSEILYLYTSSRDAGIYSPYLNIDYSLIEEPAEITSLSLVEEKNKYSSDIKLKLGVQDTETDSQTVILETRANIDSVGPTDWIAANISPSGITSSASESFNEITWSNDYRGNSYATARKIKYGVENTYSGATPSGSYIVMPNGSFVKGSLINAKDIKKNTTYRFGGAANSSLSYKVIKNLSTTLFDQALASGSYQIFSTGSVNSDLFDFYVTNSTGSTKVLYDINITEDVFDINPWIVDVRAKLTDNDGTAGYFVMSSGVPIDNRIPGKPTLIDASGSVSNVFQSNNYIDLRWDDIGNPIFISGYRYSITNTPKDVLATSTFTTNKRIQYTVPYDGKWYFNVATHHINDILGETENYGFFYNIPAEFNSASGVYVDGREIFTTLNTWIKNNLKPIFTWGATQQYQNNISYHIQVGASGGLNNFVVGPFDIKWDQVPSGSLLYSKIDVKDINRFRYLEKNNTLNVSGWYVYNSSNSSWNTMNTIGLSGTNFTKVKYVTNEYDNLPDKIDLFSRVSFGYFNNESSNFFFNPYEQEKYAAAISGNYSWEFREFAINASGINTNSYIAEQNLGLNTYYLRLRVFDGFQYGNWSNLYKFKINSPPTSPTDLYVG